MSDHRIIADGLFPGGMNPANLTEVGRAQVRAAVEALLRIYERDNARLALALEQLDKAAAEIERLTERCCAAVLQCSDQGIVSWNAAHKINEAIRRALEGK